MFKNFLKKPDINPDDEMSPDLAKIVVQKFRNSIKNRRPKMAVQSTDELPYSSEIILDMDKKSIQKGLN